jgi:hypothetical protein
MRKRNGGMNEDLFEGVKFEPKKFFVEKLKDCIESA